MLYSFKTYFIFVLLLLIKNLDRDLVPADSTGNDSDGGEKRRCWPRKQCKTSYGLYR